MFVADPEQPAENVVQYSVQAYRSGRESRGDKLGLAWSGHIKG